MKGTIDNSGHIKGKISNTETLSGFLSTRNRLSGKLTDTPVMSGRFGDGDNVLKGKLQSPATLKGKMLNPKYIERPRYQGDYTVIPSASEQILDTKGFVMSDDVTVTEVPYHAVSNEFGTTVSIVS